MELHDLIKLNNENKKKSTRIGMLIKSNVLYCDCYDNKNKVYIDHINVIQNLLKQGYYISNLYKMRGELNKVNDYIIRRPDWGNLLNRVLDCNRPNCIFKLVDNIEERISRLILLGYSLIYQERHIYILTNLDSVYLLSDIMLKLDSDCFRIYSFTCTYIKNLYIDNLDLSDIKSFKKVFSYNHKLEKVYLKNIYMLNAFSVESMFEENTSMIKVYFDNIDTSTIDNFNSMFKNCVKLKCVNINSFDMSSATTINYMFSNCFDLELVDFSNWTCCGLVSCLDMFENCISLKHIKMCKMNKFVNGYDWFVNNMKKVTIEGI